MPPERERSGVHGSEEDAATWIAAREEELRSAGERAEELRLQAEILDHLGEAVVVSDAQGAIAYWNAAAEGIYGWSAEEALGRVARDLLHPNLSTQELDAIVVVLREQGRWHGEIQNRRRDGSLVQIEASATTLPAPDGSTLRISVHRDVTSRKEAEEALRVEHERVRRLIDSNIVGVVVAGPNGKVTVANDYFLRLIGFTREELDRGGVDWRAITPAEWLPADDHAIEELREHGTCSPYEKEYVRRDGTRVPVLLADAMLPGPGEKIIAFALDLTERKRAEGELHDSELRLRSLFENMLEGYAYCRMIFEDGRPADFEYLDVNRAFTDLTGLRDVIGRRVSAAIPGVLEANPELLEIYGRVTRSGVPERFETQLPGLGGLLLSIAVYRPEPGCFVAVFEDITRRRRTERELNQRMNELGCMLGVSQDVGTGLAAQELCDRTARHLVRAMQFPDLARATVTLDGPVVSIGSREETEVLEAPIRVRGGLRGSVVVRYTEPRDFVPEERILVESVARMLQGWFERRDALRELSGSEERFRFLAEHARDMVYRYRMKPEPGFEYVSPSATAITGYTPDEHYGDPDLGAKIVHPDDRELIQHVNGAAPLVVRWVRKDGAVMWIEQHNTSIYDEEGELVAIEGIARDVTARVVASERLRASYEALRRSNEQRQHLLARLVKAQEEERLRLANDIHDDSVQVMTAVEIRLGVLRARLSPDAAADLEPLEEVVESAIARLRRMLFDLRPSVLDDSGLVAAVEEFISRLREHGGPRVVFEHDLEREPPPDVRVVAYRVIQEALTNVRKHASASLAGIDLHTEGPGLRTIVTDDGVGFDPAPNAARPDHIGLASMRERVEMSGGTFEVQSGGSRGTTISFWLPITRSAQLDAAAAAD